jgi:hypothetical protein
MVDQILTNLENAIANTIAVEQRAMTALRVPTQTVNITWPSYTGKVQLIGTSASGRVVIYVDPTLGQAGTQNGQDLLKAADTVILQNDAWFGTTGGSVNVIIFALNNVTDGTGGADHMGCDFVTGGNIEVDASFGNSERCVALFEAEYSECAMNGNLCGLSTGEALSRWAATLVSNNALSDFATAPIWVADGSKDFVTVTDQTDGNADSTGCGMAFISWLLFQKITFDKIAQGMVKLGNPVTLAQLYHALTGDTVANALPKFRAALKTLPKGVQSDNPFGA